MPGIDLSSVASLIESLVLLDTVRISQPGTGAPVLNEDTGEYTYPEGTVVYEGKGAVLPGAAPGGVAGIPVAGQPWVDETRSPYKALTPLAAPAAARDMVVTVTAVHPGGDTTLLGRQWRVTDPSTAATLTAVRITALDQIQQEG
ncbi:DUF6093 family protein [Streptomyces sp. NPDC059740]|uniref:DUF6093 family protein n=1 Tax=Streptomyces sp. NPDC059740 TaxID=3346926 RepID=UPI00365465AA